YARSRDHRDLHSFPTRRSSDLQEVGSQEVDRPQVGGEEVGGPQGAGAQGHEEGRAEEGGPQEIAVGAAPAPRPAPPPLPDKTRRSEEHTSELQSRENLVCRLLL